MRRNIIRRLIRRSWRRAQRGLAIVAHINARKLYDFVGVIPVVITIRGRIHVQTINVYRGERKERARLVKR